LHPLFERGPGSALIYIGQALEVGALALDALGVASVPERDDAVDEGPVGGQIGKASGETA